MDQITVVPNAPGITQMGNRDPAVMKACFPESPMYGGAGSTGTGGPATPAYDDAEEVKAFAIALLQTTGGDELGDNYSTAYYDIAGWSRDYSANGAPNITEVTTGAGGLPGTPWVPNPASPGPGSVDPSDLLATSPDLLPQITAAQNSFPSTGGGATIGGGVGQGPSATSANIDSLTIGQYMAGYSGVGTQLTYGG